MLGVRQTQRPRKFAKREVSGTFAGCLAFLDLPLRLLQRHRTKEAETQREIEERPRNIPEIRRLANYLGLWLSDPMGLYSGGSGV